MIIRKLRLDKGYSQEQLASMAGVSTRTLRRIERGANSSPETLKCLAAVLEDDFMSLSKEHTMPAESTQTVPEMTAEEREAMEYVRDIKAFYMHAIQYGVVMIGLTILNLATSPDYFWVTWPALGWGIGLASHGLNVFEIVNFFDSDWEKRQIERRLNRK